MAPLTSISGLLELRSTIAIPALIIASIIAYTVGSIIYNLFISPLRHIPGPKLWAISQLPQCRLQISGNGHKQILELHQKYGNVVRVSPNNVSLHDPKGWKELMGHRKAGQGENGKDPLFFHDGGKGIIGSDTENHGRLRRILSHAFSAQAMLEQEPLIRSYIDLLFDRLKERCNEGSTPLDLVKWYNWTTFDVIGDLAFGESFGCLHASSYHAWVAIIFAGIKQLTLAIQIRRIWPGISNFLGQYVFKKVAAKRYQHIQLSNMKVEKRLKLGASRPDFMTAMMAKDEAGNPKMTLEEIQQNARTLIVAGSETTATALSGATFLLCTNPQVLTKLVDEVRSSFTSESEITLLSVQRLKYMLAVLDESMRIYPPVPASIPRKIQPGGDVICGHYLPGGTIVHIWQWPMYHNASNFTLPENFIPERWLGDPRFANDQREGFQPFSFGSRNCIGRNLAYAEMRLILARLVWNFDIGLAEESKDWLSSQKVYLLWDKGVLNIHLRPRKADA